MDTGDPRGREGGGSAEQGVSGGHWRPPSGGGRASSPSASGGRRRCNRVASTPTWSTSYVGAADGWPQPHRRVHSPHRCQLPHPYSSRGEQSCAVSPGPARPVANIDKFASPITNCNLILTSGGAWCCDVSPGLTRRVWSGGLGRWARRAKWLQVTKHIQYFDVLSEKK